MPCGHLPPVAVGAVISPLLGNIHLHYVFELWADRWRRQEARGDVIVVRYADDLVAGFEHEDDARRFGGRRPGEDSDETESELSQSSKTRWRSWDRRRL